MSKKPKNPVVEKWGPRVVRGGNWQANVRYVDSTIRFGSGRSPGVLGSWERRPLFRRKTEGFRIVKNTPKGKER